MKTYIYLFLFLLMSITVKAQPYQSLFGKTSTSWIFLWGNLFGDFRDSAYVQKDTIVNGVTYKKVMTLFSQFHGGLLREDTAVGKVWYRDVDYNESSNPSDTIERLAFRYDLVAGSTFQIDNVRYQGVDTVDSVKTINGLKYTYFKTKIDGFEQYTIIEGIGSNLSILCKHFPTVMQGQYLLCTYKDGIKTPYENIENFGSCIVHTGAVAKLPQSSEIELYPNPAYDVLQIANKNKCQIQHAQIVETTGRVLFDIHQPNITSVSLQSLSSGLFFIRLFSNDQSVITKSFTIQK